MSAPGISQANIVIDLSGKKEEEYNDQQFLDIQQYGEPVKSSHTVETDVL